MREITLFWRRDRLLDTDIAPLLDIVSRAEFLAYIKRTPKDIRMLLKTNFHPRKGPEDLNSLYFLELIDIHHEPENSDESYVLNLRLSHPLSNFNARTGGTTAVPGCRLDGEGMTYIVQGGAMRLRLLVAMARLMAKPDRISARSLNLENSKETGVLNSRQLRLAKFAYDRGWYNVKKGVRISEMAEELGMARATLSEHLTRIECIVMDDLMGSFSNIRITKKEVEDLKSIVIDDGDDLGVTQEDGFKKLLANIKSSMQEEDLLSEEE